MLVMPNIKDIENNTRMCGNMKFISSVVQYEKYFPFPSIHVLFCLLYKIIVLLPHKNRAVNVNAFHDNRHMWDFMVITHVRLSILLVAETFWNWLFQTFFDSHDPQFCSQLNTCRQMPLLLCNIFLLVA